MPIDPCPLAVDTHLEGVSSDWELNMTKRHRRKFTDEFKAEAVKLIRTRGRTVGSVVQGAVADMVAKFPVQPTPVQPPQ
jgi:hypothetical protein